MCGAKNITKLVFITFSSITTLESVSRATSVYAITNHGTSTITAYDIDGTTLEYQTDIAVPWGTGPVGLALDPESDTLFVTYDGAEVIELINAKTMEEIEYVEAPLELAGVEYDEGKRKLYGVSRDDNKLCVYIWKQVTKELTLEGAYKNLANIGDAYGLALDEDSGRLFVTDATNAVKYYDTGDPDFGYLGSIPI